MIMTGESLIKSALRGIQSYQSGEMLAQADQSDCLEALNLMLDSWSTDHLYVFGTNENIFSWVSGQAQYRIGNPTNAELGEANFTGTLASGSPTISGITNMPTDLIAGATLTDVANVIPAGTTVLSVGATTVTMSANATATPSTGTDSIGYTVPGDFVMDRPMRITGGYTRFNQLDYTLDVYATQDEYNSVLYKAQPGPWPVIAWYNNTYPYGLLNVFQTPGNGSEVHLFSDTLLTNVTLTSTFQLPLGYARALKWCLALELWPEYKDSNPPPMLMKLAGESLDMIKALNEKPAMVSSYDSALTGPRADYGWILHGGYGRN